MVGAAAAAVGMGIESAPGPGVLRIELPELKPEAKELVASTLALSDKDDSSAKRTSCVILHLSLRIAVHFEGESFKFNDGSKKFFIRLAIEPCTLNSDT